MVVEAMHDSAARDVPILLGALADELYRGWAASSRTALLTPTTPTSASTSPPAQMLAESAGTPSGNVGDPASGFSGSPDRPTV
ncbi:hypothetical protein C1I95_05380 [Micromonospora craterilacus]|uniref:Uncharacterized protein n=1 Tax=Micromonospora craterilacus TaxID=1655439 RepID=A0A2W2FKT6_9ACTN|nr:hypothetical protein C1I95_05380 [Micromonospora craterilacus]